MLSFRTPPLSQHPLMTLLTGSTAILLVICIVSYPDQAFQASLQGLTIWWNIIFPALLPFLVLSEMLYAYGFVHGLGIMLDPLMRFMFRIPGVGGWAWSVGWTAGYPAGTKAVVQLRKQHAMSRQEAERLLSLSHAGSPIFIVVVVGVGFMQQPALGLIIAIVHWASAMLTAMLLHFLDRAYPELEPLRTIDRTSTSRRAFCRRIMNEMENVHRQDGRPFGRLLGESVSSAVQTLMMVGGYMMIFSVIIQVMRIAVPYELSKYVLNGLLEVNLAAYTLSSATFTSPIFQAAVLSSAIAWSGISAHLQVHSLIKETDLRFSRFLLSRFLHAATAFLLTYMLWSSLQSLLGPSNSSPTTISTFTANDTTSRSIFEAEGLMFLVLEVSRLPVWAQVPILIPVISLFLLTLFFLALTVGKLLVRRK